MRVITTYLIEKDVSQWEKDWKLYRSQGSYFAYTKSQALLFLIFGLIVTAFPFLLIQLFNPQVNSDIGLWVVFIVGIFYEIFVFGMGFKDWFYSEEAIQAHWESVLNSKNDKIMENNKNKNTKLKGLAFWGALIGLIGGIIGALGGSLSLWDRFIPPGTEIIEIIPVAVHSEDYFGATQSKHSTYGISAIVHLRSKNRSVLISGLDLSGKIYMSVNEYIPDAEGKNINEIGKEVRDKKPYSIISWSAWPKDSHVAIRLEPYEERYILFTFLEPSFLSNRLGGEEYLGVESANKRPKRVRTYPDKIDIFELRVSSDGKSVKPIDIRYEIKSGLAKFYLRVGTKSLEIPTNKLNNFKTINKKDWEERTPQELLLLNY